MEEPRLLGNRYELGVELGRGGMAEVFKARDIRLGRTVAVKTLRADMARDATFQARFRREARSTASLNHPDVVAVYDTGESTVDGLSLPYIVMEYVDGETLRDLLHSDEQLLPERAMEIIAGVLQALDYSHRNGIVHRDIKPANIMLNRSGAVKVMDFGIARAMGDIGMTMTQTSAVIGTAQYLSPEQAKGERADARSDLYSTGCLLYELLTGRPPFIGDSPVAVAYQHVREIPQPPSYYDPEVPAVADAIVLKSLGKQPDERYQSAEEMRADLERALDGRPIMAETLALAGGRVRGPALTDAVSGRQRGGGGGSKNNGNKNSSSKNNAGKSGSGKNSSGSQGLARRSAPAAVDPLVPAAPGEVEGDEDPYPLKRRVPNEDPNRTRTPDRLSGGAKPAEKSTDMSNFAIIAASVIIVLALGIIVYKTLLTSTPAPVVNKVPSIVGMSTVSAKTALAGKDLQLASSSDCFGSASSSTTVAAGKIISQVPQPGKVSTNGETVSYCLSTGFPTLPLNFTVANLNSLTYTQVAGTLGSYGFLNILEKQMPNATVQSGHVIDVQNTGGNSLTNQIVPVNEQLVILVSTGRATATVPGDLVGLSCVSAEQILQEAKFQTSFLYEYSDALKAGQVIGTSPGGNAPTYLGSPVTIDCSNGANTVSNTPTTAPPKPTQTF